MVKIRYTVAHLGRRLIPHCGSEASEIKDLHGQERNLLQLPNPAKSEGVIYQNNRTLLKICPLTLKLVIPLICIIQNTFSDFNFQIFILLHAIKFIEIIGNE